MKEKREKKASEIERLRLAMLKLLNANVMMAQVQETLVDKLSAHELDLKVVKACNDMRDKSTTDAHARITRLERLLKFQNEWNPNLGLTDEAYSISLGWGAKRKMVNGEVK